MALIPCQKCGKSISDKATACPHCGHIQNVVKSSVPGNNPEDLEVSSVQRQQNNIEPDVNLPEPRKPKGRVSMVWLIVVIVVLIGAVVGFLIYDNHVRNLREAKYRMELEDSIYFAKKKEKAAEQARLEKIREDSIELVNYKIEIENKFISPDIVFYHNILLLRLLICLIINVYNSRSFPCIYQYL